MTCVMGYEPAEGMAPEDLKEKYAGKTDEHSLAEAYALAHNEAWWVEDNIYDFEVGTEEYAAAVAVADAWMALTDEYKARIFEILRGEGVQIPDKCQIKVLAPFMKRIMKRNGFLDGRGWWIGAAEIKAD